MQLHALKPIKYGYFSKNICKEIENINSQYIYIIIQYVQNKPYR